MRPLLDVPHAKLESFFAAEAYRHGGDRIAGQFKVLLDADVVRELCPGAVGDFWLSLDVSYKPRDPMVAWCDASKLWGGPGIAPDIGGFVFDREREDDAVQFILGSLDSKVYDDLVAPVLSADGLRAGAVMKIGMYIVQPMIFRSRVALLFAAGYPELAEDAIAEYLTVPDRENMVWARIETREHVEAFADWARSVSRSRWDEFRGDWTLPMSAD